MIGIVDVAVQAHNPEMPLFPMKAFAGSPSSIRVRNVPRQIGSWKITNVVFSVVYPDGQTKSVQCVPVNNIWLGTIAGSDATGTTANGYTIFASGIDENGNQVNDYVLGKGDVEILDNSGLPDPSQPVHFVTTDEMDAALSGKADLSAVDEMDAALSGKADLSAVDEMDAALSGKADLSAFDGYLPLSGGTMDNGAVITIRDEQENLALIIDGQNGRLVGNFNTLDNFGGFSFDGHAKYTLGDQAPEGFEVQPVEQNNKKIMRSGDVYAALPYALATITPDNGGATLIDRAANSVPVTGDTTLTLPALANAGKARDFIVRLAISSSTVPTVTFAAPTGETITYETDGDEFPVPDAEGTWLYSFTETAAGVFAVSLKSVNAVTQGGM